jgi:hypothetical protein
MLHCERILHSTAGFGAVQKARGQLLFCKQKEAACSLRRAGYTAAGAEAQMPLAPFFLKKRSLS